MFGIYLRLFLLVLVCIILIGYALPLLFSAASWGAVFVGVLVLGTGIPCVFMLAKNIARLVSRRLL